MRRFLVSSVPIFLSVIFVFVGCARQEMGRNENKPPEVITLQFHTSDIPTVEYALTHIMAHDFCGLAGEQTMFHGVIKYLWLQLKRAELQSPDLFGEEVSNLFVENILPRAKLLARVECGAVGEQMAEKFIAHELTHLAKAGNAQ